MQITHWPILRENLQAPWKEFMPRYVLVGRLGVHTNIKIKVLGWPILLIFHVEQTDHTYRWVRCQNVGVAAHPKEVILGDPRVFHTKNCSAAWYSDAAVGILIHYTTRSVCSRRNVN